MAKILAQTHTDKLVSIKKNIDSSYKFFRNNYQRFNSFRNYLFKEQIDPSLAGVLNELQLPQLEFNIIYPYISRMLGEFSSQEPSPMITSISGQGLPDIATSNVIQDYFRHKIDEAKEDDVVSESFKTLLSGGMCVLKIYTEYLHEQSFDQEIRFGLVYSSDMCGFDPLSVKPHKGDGAYCWEAFPKSEDELKELVDEENYPIDWEKITYSRKLSGGDAPLQWSYANQNEKIALVVTYYFKEKKKVRIVKVRDHHSLNSKNVKEKYNIKNNVMSKEDYDRFVDDWNSQGMLEQAPGIIGEPRNTYIETICRYILVEDQILDYTETDFPILPLVFVGNATKIRTSESGSMEEFTMPYGWHAKGMQDLKNYAGNVQCGELQNMIQHKFMVAEEALPDSDDYKKAYADVQHATLLVHKAYADFNPDKPLPAPQIVNRQMVPPIIGETFNMADQGIQNCMGSYDAQLGINSNQLSGVAIVNGATQNNAVAMPYVQSLMVGLSRVFTGILKMMPKYFATPRTLPVKNNKGKRGYVLINQPVQMGDQSHEIKFEFDENDLKVRIEAGVNYEIQRMANLQMINQGMQANPMFAQFMGSKGLKVYVKNMKVTNSDELIEMADEYMKEMQQQQQMQQKMAQQGQMNNPLMIKEQNAKMDIQRKMAQDQTQSKIDVAELGLRQQDQELKKIELALKAKETSANVAIQFDKHQAEKVRASVDLAMQAADMRHRHDVDAHNAITNHHNNLNKHALEAGRLNHEVGRTILQHRRHESLENARQESEENIK